MNEEKLLLNSNNVSLSLRILIIFSKFERFFTLLEKISRPSFLVERIWHTCYKSVTRAHIFQSLLRTFFFYATYFDLIIQKILVCEHKNCHIYPQYHSFP